MKDARLPAAAVLAAAVLFSALVLASGGSGGTVSLTGAGPEKEPQSGLIDINSAGAEELDLLPGIGPAKAEAILEYRAANGTFSDVRELLEVPGIGEVTLEGLRDYICVKTQEEDP